MRPALGTAFLVVLVAGVGVLFLSDRSTPRSVSDPTLSSTPLIDEDGNKVDPFPGFPVRGTYVVEDDVVRLSDGSGDDGTNP